MTVSPLTAAPTTDTPAAAALSDLLFGDFRAHRPWAELITGPHFSHRSGLSATEQIGLADGYVTPAVVRQLPTAVDDITGMLAPHMLTLTEAFALEGYLASVPLAHANYQHAYGPATAGQPDDRVQTSGGQAA